MDPYPPGLSILLSLSLSHADKAARGLQAIFFTSVARGLQVAVAGASGAAGWPGGGDRGAGRWAQLRPARVRPAAVASAPPACAHELVAGRTGRRRRGRELGSGDGRRSTGRRAPSMRARQLARAAPLHAVGHLGPTPRRRRRPRLRPYAKAGAGSASHAWWAQACVVGTSSGARIFFNVLQNIFCRGSEVSHAKKIAFADGCLSYDFYCVLHTFAVSKIDFAGKIPVSRSDIYS